MLRMKVSGEYAMLYHGAAAGAFDLKNTLLEVLTGMRRCITAEIIFSFFSALNIKFSFTLRNENVELFNVFLIFFLFLQKFRSQPEKPQQCLYKLGK